MLNEYEVIKSVKQLSANVPKETIGTILIVYDTNPIAYEVEFVDDLGNSLDILTVFETDICSL